MNIHIIFQGKPTRFKIFNLSFFYCNTMQHVMRNMKIIAFKRLACCMSKMFSFEIKNVNDIKRGENNCFWIFIFFLNFISKLDREKKIFVSRFQASRDPASQFMVKILAQFAK